MFGRVYVVVVITNDSFSAQKKEQQKAENAEGAAGKKKKVTAAQLRVQKGEFGPLFCFHTSLERERGREQENNSDEGGAIAKKARSRTLLSVDCVEH